MNLRRLLLLISVAYLVLMLYIYSIYYPYKLVTKSKGGNRPNLLTYFVVKQQVETDETDSDVLDYNYHIKP